MMPFYEELSHEFIPVLKISNLPVVLDPQMGLESVLEPQLDVLFLPLFVILVAQISECEDRCNLSILADLLVLDAVKVSLHLPLENPG